MNYKLKPGDTATITQEDGEILSFRVYGTFLIIKAERPGTTIHKDMDSDFIMAVKAVKREEQEHTKRKEVQVRADDEVVELMRSRFPDRVGIAKVMDFFATTVLGVKINIDGLTHDVLIDAGMSYGESVHLLGK